MSSHVSSVDKQASIGESSLLKSAATNTDSMHEPEKGSTQPHNPTTLVELRGLRFRVIIAA